MRVLDVYQREGITLYLGDCREVMADMQPGDAHALVTDPPYGLGGSSGTINKARAKGLDDDPAENVQGVYAPAVRRALEICERGIVTPGGKHAWKYPEPETVGFIHQPASTGLCSWGACTGQPVLFYGRDPRLGKKIGRIVYQCTEAPPKCNHPCPKPDGVALWMVERASLEGEIVLDPFAGSGSTLVACIKLGRRGIGVEIRRDYFDEAVSRIEDAFAGTQLFSKAIMTLEARR